MENNKCKKKVEWSNQRERQKYLKLRKAKKTWKRQKQREEGREERKERQIDRIRKDTSNVAMKTDGQETKKGIERREVKKKEKKGH